MSIITIMSSNSMTMMFEKQPEAHNLFPSPSLSLSPFAGPWPTNRTRDPSEKKPGWWQQGPFEWLVNYRFISLFCGFPGTIKIGSQLRNNRAPIHQPELHKEQLGWYKKVLQVVVPVPSIQLSQGRFIADFNAIPSRHLEYSLFFPSTPTFDPYVCLSVYLLLDLHNSKKNLKWFPAFNAKQKNSGEWISTKGWSTDKKQGMKNFPPHFISWAGDERLTL